MVKWEIDFGTVSCWDENEETFHPYGMKLFYDSEETYPYRIQTLFEDGTPQGFSIGKELTLEKRDGPGVVSLCGHTLQLNSMQLLQLLEVGGKWTYGEPASKPVDLSTWMPNEFSKDVGLIYYYLNEERQFVAAHLWIGFDWNSERPIIFHVITFGDSKAPQYRSTSNSEELELNYQGEIEGLHYYLVCEQNCLLTTAQVDILNGVIDQLNQ